MDARKFRATKIKKVVEVRGFQFKVNVMSPMEQVLWASKKATSEDLSGRGSDTVVKALGIISKHGPEFDDYILTTYVEEPKITTEPKSDEELCVIDLTLEEKAKIINAIVGVGIEMTEEDLKKFREPVGDEASRRDRSSPAH